MKLLFPCLLLLAGCQPAVSKPEDLARISALEAANQQLASHLAAADAKYSSLLGATSTQVMEIRTWQDVGRAYLAVTHQTSDLLVLCHPVPPMEADGTITTKLPVPTRNEPWVQVTISPDCGEPMVLGLVSAPQEPASQPLASINEEDPE